MNEEEETITKGNVQAALDLLADTHATVHYSGDWLHTQQSPFVTLAQGMRMESLKPILDQYREVPERMTGNARLNDLESLAAYVNLYKRAESLVFLDDVDPKKPCVHVVFDAHQPNTAGDEGPSAGWGQFRASYQFPLSPEWVAWRDIADQWLGQAAFAAFVQDHILDVADPSDPGERARALAAELGLELAGKGKLYELSRGLAVAVNQKVVNTINLSTGEGQVTFEEEHAGKGGERLRIPGAFCVALPVFRGADTAYWMIVMLRYRVVDGLMKWQISPHLLDRVFEEAIKGAADQLREKTAIPVLRGRPA